MNNLINVENKIAGFYTVRVLSQGGLVKKELSFKNLITDNGLNLWAGSSQSIIPTASYSNSLSNVCCVGSSSQPPSVSDTQLGSFVGETTTAYLNTTSDVNQTNAPFFVSAKKYFQFAVGAAAGNISEVGVGTSRNSLFSRALIIDSLGNPTTIQVLPDEILQIEYEIVYFINEGDQTGEFSLSGNAGDTYEYIARPAYFYHNTSGHYFWNLPEIYASFNPAVSVTNAIYSGDISDISNNCQGTRREGSRSVAGYVNNSFERKYHLNFSTGQGNGTSNSISVGMGIGCYQFQLNKPITKTNMQTLGFVFSQSWARA